MLRLGIVGLPNVGKSTLFNALTRAEAEAANYPFCTVKANVGVAAVPDHRLDRLAARVPREHIVPVTVEFVDIAGLVEGASRGEGLGNQFLAEIRNVDAVIHCIRCFRDTDVSHVTGDVDPVRDHDVVTTELALADLATVERRLERVTKEARSGDEEAQAEAAVLQETVAVLNAGRGARDAATSETAARVLRQLDLLTLKPVLCAANIDEHDLGGPPPPTVEALRAAVRGHHEHAEVVVCSAQFEAELVELAADERAAFLASANLEEPGLDRLIKAGYRLLDLETFFTIGEHEIRAWEIPRGATAYEAAGTIHSDFQRGFIRAEAIHVDELLEAGSYKVARDRGLIRSEGRDYRVQDGDVLLFRFNV